MVVFAIGIEHVLDVTVQRFHDTNPCEHRRAVVFGHQDQRFHRGLPFLGVVFGLRQFRDVQRCVAQGDQLLAFGQRYRLIEFVGPAQCSQPSSSTSILKPAGIRGASWAAGVPLIEYSWNGLF
jgi:hypothetical protein